MEDFGEVPVSWTPQGPTVAEMPSKALPVLCSALVLNRSTRPSSLPNSNSPFHPFSFVQHVLYTQSGLTAFQMFLPM